MKGYMSLHHEEPHRELYVFHTDRQELDILERRWLGIRGVRVDARQSFAQFNLLSATTAQESGGGDEAADGARI